jgi:HAD superfamily hydrolase (TIGR01662 family)
MPIFFLIKIEKQKAITMKRKLIIFDADGTLVDDMNSVTFDDNVVAKLVTLRHEDVMIAIASNQGGVGLRHWMESAGFGEPDEYPTQQDAMARLSTITGNVSALTGKPCRIYAAFAYRTKVGKWAPTPSGSEGDPMWSQEWRKPNAGMLLQAMQDAGATPAETLFIGDMDTDEQAANAAGVEFIHADRFFAPDEDDDQSRHLRRSAAHDGHGATRTGRDDRHRRRAAQLAR